MTRCAPLFLLFLFAAASSRAQTPTGAIAGFVTDPSGAALPDVQVSAVNRDTGQSRTVTTSTEGAFSAPALSSGVYDVLAVAAGFKRVERSATVEAGATTTLDLSLELGEVAESVTVRGAEPLMRYDHHQVGGVVTREQIESLPLNGRNFLELAKLEPGVTNPVRDNGRTFVSSLGAGLQTIPRIGYTRVTVDGVSLTTPGTIGTLLQVSQDVVQEFRISTVNFDASTSLASNGAINIVTRSGGNEYHGTGFTFYRDHHLAAYPVLRRDLIDPHPFFRRHQFGSSAGGPIRRNRTFFFTSYERHDQRGLVTVQPGDPEFAPLGGVFSTPALANLFNARVDTRLTARHNAFVRYTRDDNSGAGAANTLPSGWGHATRHTAQSLAALTSVLSDRLVNESRLSYFLLDTSTQPATSEDCRNCFGVGMPRVVVSDVGFMFGSSSKTSTTSSRFQLTDALAWQKGPHRLRFGFDWEHAAAAGYSLAREPAQITLWSPSRTRQANPAIPLPDSFTTVDDILRLPLRSFETAVGPGAIPQRDFGTDRIQDLYRVYASDTWNPGARLTINGGLSWSYEPNALNYDLTKPALLGPILGTDRLRAPKVQTGNFSPTVGFAWMATRDGRTVVRAGAGRYFDPVASSNALNLDHERLILLPAGTSRLTVSGQNIPYNGRLLDFRQPTTFTGADLLAILPGIRADLLRSISPGSRDFSVRAIDVTKEGENLYDPSYATPYAIHLNIGLQREIAQGFIVGTDIVWKRFTHTFINGIDYNRWGSTSGPVIPACTEAQRDDVRAICSNGSLYFDTTIGRARYKGLLVRAEKRAGRGVQFLGSYALGSFVGTNGTGTGTFEASGGREFGFNNDDWFENYGPLPTDLRHVLNLSGFVELPGRFQLAVSVAAYSAAPFAAYVAGVDFNGDGTVDDLLPGTRVNQFRRGLGKDDLKTLVDAYNRQYANTLTPGGQIAPFLTLPEDYTFGDGFFTQDLRLTRTFGLGAGASRLSLFAEVFNLLNSANLTGYGGNLAAPTTFGQPSARISQVAGSGGPRVFQFGARATF